ncbi:MAG: sigma-54-dependent Fis family transcriptional regulator [Deltaproteobacteria bacterium]|nr:sigma-54-dependent Fis family transcriptional regulator [Deltaproteobacteria bacterium]
MNRQGAKHDKKPIILLGDLGVLAVHPAALPGSGRHPGGSRGWPRARVSSILAGTVERTAPDPTELDVPVVDDEEALGMLSRLDPALVVADQRMPGMSGIELLREAKRRCPDAYAILLTAYADLDVLIDALNSGAVDRYVQKPWDSKEFAAIMRQGIKTFATVRENRRLREQLAQYAGYLEKQQRDPIDFGEIVAGGEATRVVLDRVAALGPTDSPVLIEGEPGLEKPVVARAIHVGSAREGRPFVSVTCAAFAGEALERELFGWAAGSFEGALRDRAGRFELADGGTLYLHEPALLSLSVQARLLRALGEGQVERVGETLARRVDVRLIVAVTPDLAAVLAAEEAVPDLVSRLQICPIRLLPLRGRREDIRPLAEHFLRKYAQRNARAATAIAADALARLEAYDWPGNVRELENAVERAAILARGDVIDAAHLSFGDRPTAGGSPAAARAVGRSPGPADRGAPDGLSLDGRLDAIERRELLAALEQHGGNKAEVARALGIHRTTLYYRLKRLGIEA